jgi:hypothetical protein
MLRKTPMNRGTKELKRSGFKQKATVPLQRTKLAKKGKSDVALCKDRIQALLRKLVIERDGGCVLRHYWEAGECGGYKQDGELILQAEHLITRSNSISYEDPRNIVCLCKHHHGHWKPQHSRQYWTLIHQHVGPEISKWLDDVEADKRTYRYTYYDWQKVEMELRQQLNIHE